MPAPAVTYTFSNGSVADGSQVSQNFTDIISSLTDGLKDLTIGSLTLTTKLAIAQGGTGSSTQNANVVFAGPTSGGAAAPTWRSVVAADLAAAAVSSLRNAVYRSVTTTDSVGSTDETMKLSGSSFTSTLPTAVGADGKRYKFIHNGTSQTQLYTIATTSSQTIGSGSATSFILYTKGEMLWLESDGANWIIVGRNCTTPWETYTPTFTGFGTVSNVSFWSRRVHDTLEIRGKFTGGTPSATEARITLGVTGTNANANSDATKVPAIQLSGVNCISPTAAQFRTVLVESNVGYLTFGVQTGAAGGLTKQNGDQLLGNGETMSILAQVPISGWNA